MKNIVVTIPFEDECRKRLEAVSPDCRYIYMYPDIDFNLIKEANVIIGKVPGEILCGIVNLEWLQLSLAGADAYTKPGVLPDKVKLTNATGAYGLAISEHMVGTVFELYKKLNLYRDNQIKGVWIDRGFVKQVKGSVVLVVGLGDIGGQFASRMKALGAYIIGLRRSGTDKPEYVDELYLSDKLDDVLPRADIVALALPSTTSTAGLFSRERIFKMKDSSIILNVGRGNAIDTEGLCDALESGKLYGAALDVTDPEPLPEGHRLWKLENAVITPHISGYYHLRATYDNIVDIIVENFGRYIKGEELLNIIDLSTGYRKLM